MTTRSWVFLAACLLFLIAVSVVSYGASTISPPQQSPFFGGGSAVPTPGTVPPKAVAHAQTVHRSIICDGDSITEGNFVSAGFKGNWVYKMASLLGTVTAVSERAVAGQQGPSAKANVFHVGSKLTVYNLGVSGSLSANETSPTKGVLQRWDTNVAPIIRPGDDYILLIGVNDLWQQFGYKQFTEPHIDAIRAKVEAAGARFIPCTLTPMNRFSSQVTADRASLNEWVRAQSPYIDFDAANPKCDGLHPTAAGCTSMAPYAADVVRR